jgi:hypothetical protein
MTKNLKNILGITKIKDRTKIKYVLIHMQYNKVIVVVKDNKAIIVLADLVLIFWTDTSYRIWPLSTYFIFLYSDNIV